MDPVDLALGEQEAKHSTGPHEIADAADALYEAIVPPSPEMDYLTGRIALSLEETQLALGIGERALNTAIRKGQIPSVKIGNRRLVPIKALERHLEALAYAESGAIDAWQAALARGHAARIERGRRLALERRKYLRRKLRAARKHGIPATAATRDHVLMLRAELQELYNQQGIGSKVARDLELEIEATERWLNG